MFDRELYAKKFANHKATFTDYGNIKIIDFKNPATNEYRIRFLFEEDYYRLHISGDLGELIATNYTNMCFEKFGRDFTRNTGYFSEKIDCHSRRLYYYDVDKARKELKEKFDEIDFDIQYYPVDVEETIEEIIEDLDCDTGIGSKGLDIIKEYFGNYWDWIDDVGKAYSDILDVYMLAYELATNQLQSKQNISTGR